MFISVFQATDDTQGIIINIRGELVRLYLYEECSSLWVQSLNCTLSSFSQIGIIDHELSIFILSEDVIKQNGETRIISAFLGDAGNDNIIKCSTKIVYEITEHDSNHWVRLLGDMKATLDLLMVIR